MSKTLIQFRASDATQWSGALLALWWAGRGDWARAHAVAQEVDARDGEWVHAYLHRQEGDLGNAAYWYRRASQPVATGDLEAEWERIVEQLLRRTE